MRWISWGLYWQTYGMKTLWKIFALGQMAHVFKMILENLRDFCTTKTLVICFSGIFFLNEFNCIKCLQLMLNSHLNSSI